LTVPLLAVFNVTISCGREPNSRGKMSWTVICIFFIYRKALAAWSSSSNLVLLGSTSVPRLPIFSFLIRHPIAGVFLHHNYVCALLNDLFGIQARGGCACAGPYAQVSAILVLIICLLMSSNRPFYSCLLHGLAFEWLRGQRWPCDTDLTIFVVHVNQVVLMLTSLRLNEKSREVCIKARSPPVSLAIIGQVTKHPAIKWLICIERFKVSKCYF